MHDPMTQHAALLPNAPRAMAFDGTKPFAEWQKQAREKLAELLGMDTFVPCDPQFALEWTHEGQGYTEYRFQFNTEEKYRSIAHLLIPDGTKQPMPLVICLQGHSRGMHISLGRAKFPGDDESIHGGDRDFAPQILREGYAALTVEQRAFGECGGKPEPNCYQTAMSAILMGRTLIGERVWDISRAIDTVTAHFPQIDADRIALMGNSGGGTTTIYAAALEPRIKAAMPSCALAGFTESIGLLHHCSCNYVPNILRWFDMGDLMGMAAPAVYIAVNGKDDPSFPLASANREFEQGKRCYEAAGCGENVRHVVGQQGHRFYAADSWPVFRELTKW